ncbi:MAG TPA: GDSL-type esterase/lipase family protein [Xanthobacteraceae bacterium]|nr:GDSL-type esterase/lipase family protein [Xanthobacteraceae bacterium]
MTALRLLPALAVLVAAGAFTTPLGADEPPSPRIDCLTSNEVARLGGSLKHFTERLLQRAPVKIVAFGSSSTAGSGASTPENNYPNRLAGELRARFPDVAIQVINRGIGGEDAREMLARIDRDVRDEHPDLILWQVGTNALLREDGIALEAGKIREGLARMRATGADVVLIDPQYAPKVLKDPDAEPMVALLSLIAADMGVPVFRRFALMRQWRESGVPFETSLSPDLLHMNDWSYRCFARNLANALVTSFKEAAALIKPRDGHTANAALPAQPLQLSAAPR